MPASIPGPPIGGDANTRRSTAGPKRPALPTKGPALLERPARVAGHTNFNGIWQALNTAYWNLESHSAEALNGFPQLGAIAAIPAGQGVVRGGTIPYRPEALAKRNENRAKWPAADPEAKCYMLGVPRVTYHNMPFQIFQGDGDVLMVYPFAAANRVVYMTDRSELPVDSWMGKSNGTWEGDVLVVTTTGQNDQTWLDRAGKPLGTVGDPGALGVVQFSPDRRTAAVNADGDIWLYDVWRGLRTRFTFDPASALSPVWSPDGRVIVFGSNRTGRFDLYRKPADGSRNEELLYADNLLKGPTSLPPDGAYLAYGVSGDPKTGDDI